MNNSAKIIGALLVGAAVGVAIGLLLAPEKGSDTREKLADKATDLEEDVKQSIDKLKNKISEIEKLINTGLDEAKKAVEDKSTRFKNHTS